MLSTTAIDAEEVAASFATVDAMEAELQRLEGLVSQVRARQVEILAGVDHLQIPAWDGCRSLQEWIAGRLDIQPCNASDLAVLAKSVSVEVHNSLRAGMSSTDRAAGMARLENAGAADAVMERAAGVSVGQLGRLMARHRRTTPLEEIQAFRARRLWFQTQPRRHPGNRVVCHDRRRPGGGPHRA